MNDSAARSILILLEGSTWPPDLQPLVQALQAQGAQVKVQACTEPYADVLDQLEAAQTVLTWR